MSGAEDMSAYITLLLCRISDRHADGPLTLDDDFIPPARIQYSGSVRNCGFIPKEVQGPLADGQAGSGKPHWLSGAERHRGCGGIYDVAVT